MLNSEKVKPNNLYLAKVIGEKGVHKIRTRNILKRTAVVEIVDMENKPAIIKLNSIIETLK